MLAAARWPQPRRRAAAAAVLAGLLLAAAAALPGAAAAQGGGDDDEAEDYVVVFKRGFDASKVRAVCESAAAGGAAGRLAGVCRRRFSSVLNGFAGAAHGHECVLKDSGMTEQCTNV